MWNRPFKSKFVNCVVYREKNGKGRKVSEGWILKEWEKSHFVCYIFVPKADLNRPLILL